MTIMRYVLPAATTAEDIDRLADGLGWVLFRETPRSPEQPFEKIWRTPDKQTAIHYVQDDLVDVDYLFVQGANTPGVVSKLHEATAVLDADTLVDQATRAESVADLTSAIARLGVGAPDSANPAVLRVLEEALEHPATAVREATITAIGYIKWPELAEMLVRVGRDDPDDEVRALAQYLYKSFQRHSWKGN